MMRSIWQRYQLVLVLVAILVYVVWAFDFWQQPIQMDRAFFVYMGQLVARGQSLYTESTYGYAPLSTLVTGGLIALLQDWSGIASYFIPRVGGLILLVATLLGFYQCGKALFGSKLYGYVMLMAFGGITFTAILSCTGMEPKIMVLCFSIWAIYSLYQGNYFTTGLLITLAATCWQVAGIYFIALLLYPPLYRRHFLSNARWLVAGCLLALLPSVAYITYHGAWVEFWEMAVIRKISVQSLENNTPFWHWLTKVHPKYSTDLLLFISAFAGFVWYLILRLTSASKPDKAADHEIWTYLLTATILWSLFNSVEFQGGPDLIPMLSLLICFAVYAWRALYHRISWKRLLILASVLTMYADFGFYTIDYTLQDQEQLVAKLKEHYNTERVLASGFEEYYILENVPSPTKLLRFQAYDDLIIDQFLPGGWPVIKQELLEKPPTLLLCLVKKGSGGQTANSRYFTELQQELTSGSQSAYTISYGYHLFNKRKRSLELTASPVL